MNPNKNPTNARNATRPLLTGLFLLGAILVVGSGSAAAEAPEQCGNPEIGAGFVSVWKGQCRGASVNAPLTCGGPEKQVEFVTVQVFHGTHPCAIVGVWIEPPQ